MIPMVPLELLLVVLQEVPLEVLEDAIPSGIDFRFYAGFGAALWLMERVASYRLKFKTNGHAEAAAKPLETADVEAAIATAVQEGKQEAANQARDERLIALAERQAQLSKDLLRALDRRAELDRGIMATLAEVTAAASRTESATLAIERRLQAEGRLGAAE